MSDSMQERLERLEELTAHQGLEIETLSETVREQWKKIDDLTTAMLRFRDRVTELEESGGGGHENTKPPHY